MRAIRYLMIRQLDWQAGVPRAWQFWGQEVQNGAAELFELCDAEKSGGMTRCATGFHAGSGFCAPDARAAVDCADTGSRFWMGHYYATWSWPPEICEALRVCRLSITPLKYVAALYVVRVWLERRT